MLYLLALLIFTVPIQPIPPARHIPGPPPQVSPAQVKAIKDALRGIEAVNKDKDNSPLSAWAAIFVLHEAVKYTCLSEGDDYVTGVHVYYVDIYADQPTCGYDDANDRDHPSPLR
jgi:hypothetical protein